MLAPEQQLRFIGSTSFTAPPGADADLSYAVVTSGNPSWATMTKYVLTLHKSLETQTFWVPTVNSGIALLQQQVDKNGNGLTFDYNSNLTPKTITSTSDATHHLDFTDDGTTGYVIKIQDWTGRNVQYAYTGNNLTAFTDESGNTSTYTYDANPNLTQFTDPKGNVVQFTYDGGKRVLTVTRVDGSQTPPKTTYQYFPDQGDASGYTIETDPLNNKSTYSMCSLITPPTIPPRTPCSGDDVSKRDYKSRIAYVQDAKGIPAPSTWSADSAVATYKDYGSNLTNYGFNSAGGEDVDSISSASGNKSTFCFPGDSNDATCPTGTIANNPLHFANRSSDAQGNQTSFSYDGVNTGRLTQINLPGSRTINQYYSNVSGVPSGLLAGYVDSDAVVDGNGNLPCSVANRTPAIRATVCFTYDANGNVIQITYPSPLGAVSYTYDSLNRQHSMTDGKSQITGTCYDSMDRVTYISNVASTTFTCPMTSADVTKTYDKDGNLRTLVDGNGTTTYTYDYRNLLTDKQFPDLTTIDWTYDAAMNVKTQIDGAGTTTYGYDADNFLSSVTEPTSSRVINFSVDANGNRTQIQYPTGSSTQHLSVVDMAYDGANRMASLKTTYNGATVQLNQSYCYQVLSSGSCPTSSSTSDTSVLGQTIDNLTNFTTKYTYDNLNRLCDARATNSGGTQQSDYFYSFDNNGNRARQAVGGTWSGTPACSASGLTGGTNTYYAYNWANELCWTGTTAPAAVTSSTCPTGGSQTYAFDANGSQTTGFLPSGTSVANVYDNKDRTTSMTPSGGTAETGVYRGYTQSEILTWGANTFKDGILGTYRSATSTASTYYVRDNRGHVLESTSAGVRYFYVTDRLGSVLQTIDINGATANTYSYDPYGRATKTGSVADNWTFTGAWQDAGTNLYHMGARFYDPLTGRWTQKDKAVTEGCRFDYADGNPIGKIDPAGTCASGVDAAVASVAGVFALEAGLETLGAAAAVGAAGFVITSESGGWGALLALPIIGIGFTGIGSGIYLLAQVCRPF